MQGHPPRFVYKLVAASDWRRAEASGVVARSAADERDGYMHLATRTQLLETARRHFAGVTDLVALEIELADIADDVRFEIAPKRGEAFPHLYAPLPSARVRRTVRLKAKDDGTFTLPDGEA